MLGLAAGGTAGAARGAECSLGLELHDTFTASAWLTKEPLKKGLPKYLLMCVVRVGGGGGVCERQRTYSAVKPVLLLHC